MKPIEKTIEQIINLVEQKTRFDKSSLSIESSKSSTVEGIGQVKFIPTFYIKTNEGNGKNPSNSISVNSSDELEQAAINRFEKVGSELVEYIASWIRLSTANENDLRPENCFSGVKSYAFNFPCENCSQRGEVKCSTCYASGYENCPDCKTSGFIKCKRCDNGKIKCTTCRGNGNDKEGGKCRSCKGSRHETCKICNGTAKLVCERCGGRTKITCRKCYGSGWITCYKCEGKGNRYIQKIVMCEVGRNYIFDCKTDCNKEIIQYLKSLSLEEIKELGSFSQQPIHVEYGNPTRIYNLKSTVNEITVKVADSKMKIYSYGHFARIVDHKSIVENLLNNDLLDFEKSINNAVFNLFNFNENIVESTKILLSSEVNFDIDNSELLKNGTITSEYKLRVKSGLNSAFEFLIYSFSGYTFSVILMISILSLLGLDYFFELAFIYNALISVVLSVLIYFLMEMLGKDKIVKDLGGENNESFRIKINELIDDNRSLELIRYVNLGILTLVLIIIYVITHVL